VEAIIGLIGIVVSVGFYYLGRRDGRRQTDDQRIQAMADKLVDEYVALARPRHDAGPHALARLGLHILGSDARIRAAIEEMRARTDTDPWAGYAGAVEDVDLVRFFEWVRNDNVNFQQMSVPDVAQQVKAAGGKRSV